MTAKTQVITNLIIFSILLGGVAGCARTSPSTQPAVPPTALPTPTPPPNWQTHSASATSGQCGFAINYPSDMDVPNQGTYSWSLFRIATEPSGPVPNFIYISVIPDGFQSNESGAIYNYDAAETQTLLNMQVGESKALRDDPNMAPWVTYTRLPDTTLGGQIAQTYENSQPWEFPPGTKEIRYYLHGNDCIYMLGGYMATVGSGQPLAIDEELFNTIIATFRMAR
jgi:hypothetical protein